MNNLFARCVVPAFASNVRPGYGSDRRDDTVIERVTALFATVLAIALHGLPFGTGFLASTPHPFAATNPTVVSIEFDDGTADQFPTRAHAARGLHATYYVNSGEVDNDSGHLSSSQLQLLEGDGDESVVTRSTTKTSRR